MWLLWKEEEEGSLGEDDRHLSEQKILKHGTPWFPLIWMDRFVTFVLKDLFPDKYLWSSTWEIHLKILQPTPWEPVSIVEVVNKSEHERKTSSP